MCSLHTFPSHARIKFWPPLPTPEFLAKDFRLQPGLESEFLPRRTCRGKNCSHSNFQHFHSVSKENLASFRKDFSFRPKLTKQNLQTWGFGGGKMILCMVPGRSVIFVPEMRLPCCMQGEDVLNRAFCSPPAHLETTVCKAFWRSLADCHFYSARICGTLSPGAVHCLTSCPETRAPSPVVLGCKYRKITHQLGVH